MMRRFLLQYGRFLRPIPWLALLVLLLSGLVGDMSVFRLNELNVERARLRAEILEQERLNLKLKRDVRRLRTDPDYLEKLVREELRYVRPGEVVYQFQE